MGGVLIVRLGLTLQRCCDARPAATVGIQYAKVDFMREEFASFSFLAVTIVEIILLCSGYLRSR